MSRALKAHACADRIAAADTIAELRRQLQNAQAVAYMLVHAYDTDNRPPERVLQEARKYKHAAKTHQP